MSETPGACCDADAHPYAGKEGIQVDLQTSDGKEVVHKLIAKADVLSHNFRLGVSERLQVDWETCLKINPRLVNVWMATYGENGVHARRPGTHPIPGAIMEGMRQMGRGMPRPAEQVMDIEETVEATRWLVKPNWGPDQNTSPALATGIILGLRARDRTGKKGQPVHITKLNANAWTNADECYDHADRPPIAMPDEEIHGLHALYRLYRCREGCVFLGCLFQDEWETFCRTVERGDPLADGRFSTPEACHANDEALISEISAILAGRTAAEWEELLINADIGCVRADEALEGEFCADHPHAKANAPSVEMEHPYVGKHLFYCHTPEVFPWVPRSSATSGSPR